MKRAALLALLTAFAIQADAGTKVFVQALSVNYAVNEYSIMMFYDTGTKTFVDFQYIILPNDNSITDTNDAIAFCKAAIYTEAGVKGYTITDADIISNFPINGFPASPSFTYPSRSLNSSFQISSTRNSRVSYSVSIASTLSLITGQAGTVVLEYADDSGFTTNVQTVESATNGNTGTLAIGLNLTQTVSATVAGDIPASKYVRIRTVNTTGSPTFTFVSAQEVLY